MQAPPLPHANTRLAIAVFAATALGSPSRPLERCELPDSPRPVARTDDSAVDALWDLRAAEHLYNRAGFGARSAEVESGAALGPRGLVEALLATKEPWSEIEPVLVRWEDFGLDHRQRTLESSPFHKLDHDA